MESTFSKLFLQKGNELCNKACTPFKALFSFLYFNAVATEFCIGFSISVQDLAQPNTSVLAQCWCSAWPPSLLGQNQGDVGWSWWEDGNLRWVWVEDGLLYLGVLCINPVGPEFGAWLWFPVSKSWAEKLGIEVEWWSCSSWAPLVILHMPGSARVLFRNFDEGWKYSEEGGPEEENKNIQLFFFQMLFTVSLTWHREGKGDHDIPVASPGYQMSCCCTQLLPIVPQDL